MQTQEEGWGMVKGIVLGSYRISLWDQGEWKTKQLMSLAKEISQVCRDASNMKLGVYHSEHKQESVYPYSGQWNSKRKKVICWSRVCKDLGFLTPGLTVECRRMFQAAGALWQHLILCSSIPKSHLCFLIKKHLRPSPRPPGEDTHLRKKQES